VQREPSDFPDSSEEIDDVVYHRTRQPTGRITEFELQTRGFREIVIMKLLGRNIENLLSREHYDVIHAHSPILCGLPALKSAKRDNIPFVL
jgi:hypothetical protein